MALVWISYILQMLTINISNPCRRNRALFQPRGSHARDCKDIVVKHASSNSHSPSGHRHRRKTLSRPRRARIVGGRRVSQPGRRRSKALMVKRDRARVRTTVARRPAELARDTMLQWFTQQTMKETQRQSVKRRLNRSKAARALAFRQKAHYPQNRKQPEECNAYAADIDERCCTPSEMPNSTKRVQFMDQVPRPKATKGSLPQPARPFIESISFTVDVWGRERMETVFNRRQGSP